jgi:DNA-directed RNA polymerase subunit RPC12/RpoP
MGECIYFCQRCGNLFRLPPDSSHLPEKELRCPQCRDSQIRELPSWVPLGSDLDNAPAAWDYECQGCRERFKLPVPASPSQEKGITCPACDGRHIHRLTPVGYEPLYCG